MSNDTRIPMPKGWETIPFVKRRQKNRKARKQAKIAKRKNR